jgi:hypothetical protein
MGHGVHPNYASHHEANHKPRMHGGAFIPPSLFVFLSHECASLVHLNFLAVANSHTQSSCVVFLFLFLFFVLVLVHVHVLIPPAGMVLKMNANQRYATSTQTQFLIQELARERQIPLQA